MSRPFSIGVTTSVMYPIKRWEDFEPYAGSIVAYKAENSVFNGPQAYLLEDAPTRYGYIKDEVMDWSAKEKGYQLYRLVKANAPSRTCALATWDIQPSFSVRKATAHELSFIYKAISNKVAQFEHIDEADEKIGEIFRKNRLLA